MKSLIQVVVIGAALSAPVVSFAQSSEPITRAQVRSEDVQLEKSGFPPAAAINIYDNFLIFKFQIGDLRMISGIDGGARRSHRHPQRSLIHRGSGFQMKTLFPRGNCLGHMYKFAVHESN